MEALLCKSRLKILGVFAVILFISQLPVWISHSILNSYYLPHLILGTISAGLVLICPFVAAKWKPHLADFDKTWLPPRWSHIIWAVLFLIVLFAWSGLARYLLALLGFPSEGPESLVTRTIAPLILWPILFQAILNIVIVPIAEEIFWRGYSLEQFAKIIPRFLALFLQAALFSLFHFYPIGPSIRVFGIGVIFGFWRLRMRSLVPIIVVHIVINALSLAPIHYKNYTQTIAQLSLRDKLLSDPNLPDDVKEIVANFDSTRLSPEGRQIFILGTKPMSEGVPEIIEFLGHADENVSVYAQLFLAAKYGERASTYYEEALNSDNGKIVSGVLFVITQAECIELIPNIRALIESSSSLRSQVAGLLALSDLGDLEGIDHIARTHSSTNVRDAAKRLLHNNKIDRIRLSPEGRQIALLATKPMSEGVPGIIEFLGHPDEDVCEYAHVFLVEEYGDRASAYYAQALDSDNEIIVMEVLWIIGGAECTELIPNVRALIENSSSFRLQEEGLLTLSDLGDLEGIKHIAQTHPSTKVRDAAKRLLDKMDAQETISADDE